MKLSLWILVTLLSFKAMAQESYLVAKNMPKKQAPSKRVAVPKSKKITPPSARSAVVGTPNEGYRGEGQLEPAAARELQSALELVKNGDTTTASLQLFKMSRDVRFNPQRLKIKSILGNVLFHMKFYHGAAFQYVDVVRNGASPYLKSSLEKLSLAASELDDDTLLNYAISRVKLEDFPKEHHDMLRFRIGEYQYRNKLYPQAASMLAGVQESSPFWPKAKYLEAVVWSQLRDSQKAIGAFADLVKSRAGQDPTDANRVAGLLGLARIHYQAKNWDRAIEYYRKIPRDTEAWHDVLFELSWAEMRSAKFRSVLSNFHSLHSPYYEDFYIPESLLLRGIVYLYICQYEEMEKTLDLFDRVYGPVLKETIGFYNATHEPLDYYTELDRVASNLEDLKADASKRKGARVPFLVSRHVLREGDIQKSQGYIGKIREELRIWDARTPEWKSTKVGKFLKALLDHRLTGAKKKAGRSARSHMRAMIQELRIMREQRDYARIDMISGKKEAIRKKISGKGLAMSQVDDDDSRDYYIQNGFEYWPFRGEYWLDEIGNYFYLGTQSCE